MSAWPAPTSRAPWSAAGHESAQAGSGEEGLKLLAEQDFDVVITDIAMAGMNGMEVLKAVRSSKPDVEVIMVTGYPMIESAVEAMRLGAFHYLAKPYSLEEARMLVARALEKRRLRQQVAQMRAQLEASGLRAGNGWHVASHVRPAAGAHASGPHRCGGAAAR